MAGIDENTILLIQGNDLKDFSFYNRTLTNNGVSLSSTQKKFFNTSLYFNGSSNLLASPYNFTNQNFTIDWWEYPLTSDGKTRFCSQYTSTSYGGILLSYLNGGVYCSNYIGGWNVINGNYLMKTVPNTWSHWAVVRSSSTILFFFNGVLYSQINISSGISLAYDSSYQMSIGDYRTGDHCYYNGYLDEFRISNVARWTSDFTPPTEPYSVSSNMYVKIDNVWQPVTGVYTKTNNTW